MIGKADIHKAGGILIMDRKFLVGRSIGRDIFTAPGGKLEADENSEKALIRELREELGVDVSRENIEEFGTFFAKAAGHEEKTVQMDVFMVKKWTGSAIPSNEVEELMWVNTKLAKTIKMGSIFEHEVLPKLKKMRLID